MYQEHNFEAIDVFNNSSIIYKRKTPNGIISWINILVIGSLIFFLIISLYEYEDYNIYKGIVVKNSEENYIYLFADDNFFPLKNRNYFIVENKKCRGHVVLISDDYYIMNNSKYRKVNIECELPKDLNIDKNVLDIKVDKGKVTILKKVIRKIKKGINNGKIK